MKPMDPETNHPEEEKKESSLSADWEEITQKILRDSVERASLFSLFFAFIFTFYSYNSISYIQRFMPKVTAWENFWPRILCNCLPLLFLHWITKSNIKLNDKTKLRIWILGFAMQMHIAGWIYVWPIALRINPLILVFISTANVYLFLIVFIVVAPPTKHLLHFTLTLGIIFLLPLFIVAYLGKDMGIFIIVVNDSLTAIISGAGVSLMIDRLRVKIALSDLKRSSEAKKFLGPTVSQAIFEGKTDLLKSRTCHGLIISTDVRGYSELVLKNEKKAVTDFMDRYYKALNESVAKYGGHIHKTLGDGHIISFGLMDLKPDLSDIPGIEFDEQIATQRQMRSLLEAALICFEYAFRKTAAISHEFFFKQPICLGIGMTFGEVEIKVHGDESYRKELDIFGGTIIKSNRLQAYTKDITQRFSSGSSIIVISPELGSFVEGQTGWIELSTEQSPIRNFPEIASVWAKQAPALYMNLNNKNKVA